MNYKGWTLNTFRTQGGLYCTIGTRVHGRAVDLTGRQVRKAHQMFNAESRDKDVALYQAKTYIDELRDL